MQGVVRQGQSGIGDGKRSATPIGVCPSVWIKKLVSVCSREGHLHGPAFADASGVLALSPDYNSTFQGYLYRVQSETTLIDKDVDVFKIYNTYHTL